MGNRREIWIDLLRIVACIAVVLIHLTYQGTSRNMYNYNIGIWKLHTFIDIICQIAVPIFVMISGYLLIKNDKFKGKVIIYKSIKLLIVYISVSVFYSVYNNMILPGQFNIEQNITSKELFQNVILNIFSGEYHLWFIPMLIGLYLMTPLINKMENKHLLIILGIWLLFNTVESLSFIGTDKWYQPIFYYIYSFKIPLVSSWVGYYILGYLIKKNRHRIFEYIIMVLGIVCIVFVLYYSPIIAKNDKISTIELMKNMSLIYVLYTSAVFLFFKNIVSKIRFKKIINRIIIILSSTTFYIYLIHVFFIDQRFYNRPNNPSLNSIRYDIDYKASINLLLDNVKYVFWLSFIVAIVVLIIRAVFKRVYEFMIIQMKMFVMRFSKDEEIVVVTIND